MSANSNPLAAYRLLTTAEAAQALHISPNTLRQWVHRKKIQQVYPGLFDPKEIERLTHAIKEQQQ